MSDLELVREAVEAMRLKPPRMIEYNAFPAALRLLAKYGEHTRSCHSVMDSTGIHVEGRTCDCGFADLQKLLSEGKP